MSSHVHGLPGPHAARSAAYRRILRTDRAAQYLPGGVVLDGSASRDPGHTDAAHILRAGMPLGRITSSGAFAPAAFGPTTLAYDKDASDGSQLTLTVGPHVAAEVLRRVGATGTDALTLVGPATTGGTVNTETVSHTAVDPDLGTISFAAPLTHDFVDGSLVMPADGSQTPRLLIGDGAGVDVTDDRGQSVDVHLVLALVAGLVDASRIVGYPELDPAVQAWLKAQLNNHGAFVFDDSF